MNISSASRRLRRGASSVPVATFGSLRMEGRKNQTIAPHTTKATAALEVHHRSQTHRQRRQGGQSPTPATPARSIELNITASRPVWSACSRARANICGLAVEPKLLRKTPTNSRMKSYGSRQTAGRQIPRAGSKTIRLLRSPLRSERPARNWLTKMPMMALPVKKKPTIAGRGVDFVGQKEAQRVGVCNAPAIPVRKATIKKRR